VDRSGARVGEHQGAHAYTVGQRRGLNLTVPAPDGRPRFVLEVRPASNEVVVGPKEALDVAELAGRRFTWAGAAPEHPEAPFGCEVQLRAHADPVPASAVLRDGELVITPAAPIRGVAPGQTAVLYLGTRVLGQTTIDRTVSAVPVGAGE
jgi:tRNA-specific 2-thiouridylase